MHSLSSAMTSHNCMMHPTAATISKPRRALCVKCVATVDSTVTLRNAAVALAAAVSIFTALPSQAMWDGESAALGSCPLGDAGDACRTRVLSRDQLGSYSDASNNAAKLGNLQTGIPVAQLDSQYAKDTAILGQNILSFVGGDVYDASRPALVKTIKTQGQSWVSKYARGGSARTASARQFYIAIDAVGGHVAANGLAPFPKNKVPKVVKDVTESTQLIALGK